MKPAVYKYKIPMRKVFWANLKRFLFGYKKPTKVVYDIKEI